MVQYAVRVPQGRRVRSALGVALGFVVVSGLVLSTPVPPVKTPVVASGAIGSKTGPGPVTRSEVRPSFVLASDVHVRQTLPSAAAPGLRVTATPHPDSTITMSETATFASPRTFVDLKPPSIAGAGAQFDGLRPQVRQVIIWVDNQYFDTVELKGRTRIDFRKKASSVRLTYVLSGAFSRSADGSTRGATALHPLMSVGLDALPVSYQVVGGASTTSIVCPELPFGQQACGATSGVLSGLSATQSLIVLTLELPTVATEARASVPVPAQSVASSSPSTSSVPAAADPTTTPGGSVPETTSSTAAPSAGPTGTEPAPAPADTSPSSSSAPDPTTPPTVDPPPPPPPPPTTEPTQPPVPTDPGTTTPAPDPTTTEPPPIGTENQPANAPIGTEKQAAGSTTGSPIGTEMRAADPTAAPTTDPTALPTTDPTPTATVGG